MSSPPPRSRRETDREDLMREATALKERAEFRVSGDVDTVIAGYRSDGSLSIYFAPDPCYHFNPDIQLRRAYVDGDLYRTQGTTLARLHRDRSDGKVELQRHDLSTDELEDFIAQAHEKLIAFADALEQAPCLQSIPEESDIKSRLANHLLQLREQPIELAPPISGRH